VILLFCAGFSGSLIAQNTFSKGDQNLNIGIGIGDVLGGSGYSTKIPPVSVSYEYGIKDELFDEKSSLGIGAYLGYAANKYAYSGNNYGLDYTYFILGARGSLHYQLVDKLDTYGGLMLGYNSVGSKRYGEWGNIQYNASNSALLWSLYIGGRYYFTEKIGAFAELGYGIAYLQLGVSFKF
jgi:hypothetical protein